MNLGHTIIWAVIVLLGLAYLALLWWAYWQHRVIEGLAKRVDKIEEPSTQLG